MEFDYENIRRPSPEGAEDRAGQHDDAYDLAELNASFGEDAAAEGEKNAISHNSRTRYVVRTESAKTMNQIYCFLDRKKIIRNN